MSNTPKYNTPEVLTDPYRTYLGTDKKTIDTINKGSAVTLGDQTLTKHINTPGALIADSRYVENSVLDDARAGAEKWTQKIAEAGGNKISPELKQDYASAMSSLRDAHHKILPHLPFDADQRARADIEKVVEKVAHKLGKKAAVVAGFLTSSASFAGEAIDAGGKIIKAETFDSSKLKEQGENLVRKGIEGAAGVVDPLGLIKTDKIADELIESNFKKAGTAFNEARLEVAHEISDYAVELTR